MGCGTGVLGICMAMHGASQVVAIDIDPLSVENTQENFLLNQLSNFTVQQGDASAISGEFDTIVANIHKNIIIRDLPIYKAHLRQGGTLVTSGFFTSDVPDVVNAAENQGLRLTTQLSKNDWTVLVFSLA
jgi:ribosomal protein L11 methyltransferase